MPADPKKAPAVEIDVACADRNPEKSKLVNVLRSSMGFLGSRVGALCAHTDLCLSLPSLFARGFPGLSVSRCCLRELLFFSQSYHLSDVVP